MEEEVEHHKEEEVEENHEEDASDVARWATEWQIVEVAEDHEEGEEKEPIHSLVGRGGARHKKRGGERIYSFGIVLTMFIVDDNSKLSSIPLFEYLRLMSAQITPRAATTPLEVLI
eukprot:scaffold18581_cov183-Skeletonema_dohrnii-CCMP3373.AAC.2